MDNEKARVLALAGFALTALNAGDIPKARHALEHLVHGEINEDTVDIGMIKAVAFERAFKELILKTQVQAMYISWRKTGVIGEVETSVGGDQEMVEELTPLLQEIMK